MDVAAGVFGTVALLASAGCAIGNPNRYVSPSHSSGYYGDSGYSGSPGHLDSQPRRRGEEHRPESQRDSRPSRSSDDRDSIGGAVSRAARGS